MKKTTLMILVLLISQAIVAQTSDKAKMVEKRVNRIDQMVSLTTAQKAEITTIVETHTSKLIALKEANELNKQNRKEIVKSERAAIAEVLTEEQKAKLNEGKAELKEQKEAKKMVRAEKKAIKTQLEAKRAEFDAMLSAEDKATIAKARAMKPAKLTKAEKEQLTSDEKTARRATQKEIHKLLMPIAEKHKEAIKEIYAATHSENDKKKKRFDTRFLLMK